MAFHRVTQNLSPGGCQTLQENTTLNLTAAYYENLHVHFKLLLTKVNFTCNSTFPSTLEALLYFLLRISLEGIENAPLEFILNRVN